jgi:hypothetical protein
MQFGRDYASWKDRKALAVAIRPIQLGDRLVEFAQARQALVT